MNPRYVRGFTLMELIVVVLLGLILAGAIYSFFLPMFGTAKHVHEASFLQEGARANMELMLRDIRMAGSFPDKGETVPSTCDPYIEIDSDYIIVRMDITGDGDCNDSDEDVKYEYIPAEKVIKRNSEAFVGGEEGAIQVDCFDIDCYDSDGNERACNSNAMSVRVKAVLRSSRPITGYTNADTYPEIGGCGPFNDRFIRRYVEGVAAVRRHAL